MCIHCLNHHKHVTKHDSSFCLLEPDLLICRLIARYTRSKPHLNMGGRTVSCERDKQLSVLKRMQCICKCFLTSDVKLLPTTVHVHWVTALNIRTSIWTRRLLFLYLPVTVHSLVDYPFHRGGGLKIFVFIKEAAEEVCSMPWSLYGHKSSAHATKEGKCGQKYGFVGKYFLKKENEISFFCDNVMLWQKIYELTLSLNP